MSDADAWTDDKTATAIGPVSVYGASDDLVELEGGVDDEIGCYEKPVEIEFGHPGPDSDGKGVRLLVEYAPGGSAVWRIAVEPLDENVEMFPCRIPGLGGDGAVTFTDGVRKQGKGYTPLLVVECPSGTPVRWRKLRG